MTPLDKKISQHFVGLVHSEDIRLHPPFAEIWARLPRLPRQQRRLAEAILMGPALIAFSSLREVAERVNVNAATIVRFAQSFGYEGYGEFQTAVLLSAHDMNPLLSAMDRIVYLVGGRAASGTTDAVVRTEVLSQLYGYHIDVLRVHGRVIVVAAEAAGDAVAAVERDPVHVAQVP